MSGLKIDHAKIVRRARRAWRDGSRRYHRISDITATSLKYRPPTQSDYRGSQKILVTLEDDGEITIHGIVGPDTLDLLFKDDLDKLKGFKGTVRAYKGVTKDYGSPGWSQGKPVLSYKVGDTPEVLNADISDTACAAGVNLGPKSYVTKEYPSPGHNHMVVEFECPKDLASVPSGTDGKFRVFRCKVVSEL